MDRRAFLGGIVAALCAPLVRLRKCEHHRFDEMYCCVNCGVTKKEFLEKHLVKVRVVENTHYYAIGPLSHTHSISSDGGYTHSLSFDGGHTHDVT